MNDKTWIWVVLGSAVIFVVLIVFLFTSLHNQSSKKQAVKVDTNQPKIVVAKQDQSLQKKVEDLEKSNRKLRKEANDLNGKIYSLDFENRDLKNENEDLKKQIMVLKSQISSLPKQNNDKSSSALLGQIPSINNPIKKVNFDIQGVKVGDLCNKENDQVDILDVWYHTKSGRLTSISFSFDSSFFNDVVEAYTEKFGCRPHHYRSKPIKTRNGLEYINETVTWETNSGDLEISKFGNTIDEGFGWLKSPQYLKQMDEEEKERQKTMKDQL